MVAGGIKAEVGAAHPSVGVGVDQALQAKRTSARAASISAILRSAAAGGMTPTHRAIRSHTHAAASHRHVDRQVVAAELPTPVAGSRRFAEECQPVVVGRPPKSLRPRGVGQDALRRDHALHQVDSLAAQRRR